MNRRGIRLLSGALAAMIALGAGAGRVVRAESARQAAPETALALSLLAGDARAEKKNVLLSPTSILLALGMTMNGAKGETREQMREVLCGELSVQEMHDLMRERREDLQGSEGVTWQVADGIWADFPESALNSSFLDTVQKDYGAQVHAEPFEEKTGAEINAFVRENTRGMIPKIISEGKPKSQMILVNAMAYEGAWQEPWEDEEIERSTFTTAAGEKVKADFLSGWQADDQYYSLAGAKGFCVDYAGGEYAFAAFLPKKGETPAQLAGRISAGKLTRALENPKRAQVYFRMPEFTMDDSRKLNGALKKLGMRRAFTDRAQFSGITDEEELKIDTVLHKTHMTLDREGTRAAAVTEAEMEVATALPEELPTVKITLNRPYLFFVLEKKTMAPVFAGIVNVPKAPGK